MTFDLSSEHLALRDKARALADAIDAHATEIDRTARIPSDIAQEVKALTASLDPVALVVAVEPLAARSPAVGVMAGAGSEAAPALGLTGLRGAPALDRSPRAQLVLAAVALGIGKGAVDETLAQLRGASVAPNEIEKPHWVLADTATDVEAARLLTLKAAQTMADADLAIARLMTATAADRAIAAALRIAGPQALEEGTRLERLARDARAVALVLGTEEDHRAVAAEGLLPSSL